MTEREVLEALNPPCADRPGEPIRLLTPQESARRREALAQIEGMADARRR